MKTFNCCFHILQHFIQVLTVCQRIYNCAWMCKPGPEVIKLFSCSTQLSTRFILLINVKMPTVVGILTFISMKNATSERLKAINFFICRYFSFYEWFKFRAQLSWAWKEFYNLGPWMICCRYMYITVYQITYSCACMVVTFTESANLDDMLQVSLHCFPYWLIEVLFVLINCENVWLSWCFMSQ